MSLDYEYKEELHFQISISSYNTMTFPAEKSNLQMYSINLGIRPNCNTATLVYQESFLCVGKGFRDKAQIANTK